MLEAFGYFKLCIFVCNRYQLPERLGRYLVSIANQYSIVSSSNMRATFSLLNTGPARKLLLEKAMVASLAVHNAFEIINPEFFSLKDNSFNLLGTYCIRGLIYLGMYKKAAFMLSVKECLKLLSIMFDYAMYT